ncbi:MAG: hypothetical protein ACTTH7_10135, partial [Treponema sp.]
SLKLSLYTIMTIRTAMDGTVDQCTSVYTGQRRVFLAKNSLLYGTTDLLSVQQCFGDAETRG